MRRSVVLGVLFLVVVGMLMGCDEENIVAEQLFDEPLSHAQFLVFEEHVPSSGGSISGHILGMGFSEFSNDSGLKVVVKPVKIDENNSLFGPMSPLVGEARQMPQCGTYEISVFKYGEPLFHVDNFRYSAEPYVEVAQGFDWKIIITRKDLQK